MDAVANKQMLASALGRLASELAIARHAPGRAGSQASPLATAAATAALVVAEPIGSARVQSGRGLSLSEVMLGGLRWLARTQNADGGWGQCAGAPSCRVATSLARVCFQLTGVPAKFADLEPRADAFLAAAGGWRWLRKVEACSGAPSAAIAPFAAASGLIPWRRTPVGWRHSLRRLVNTLRGKRRQPEVGERIAQAALELARGHQVSRSSSLRLAARRTVTAVLGSPRFGYLAAHQAPNGGYLDSIPLTSCVVLCLSTAGLADHPLTCRAIEFLLTHLRSDGSWPLTAPLVARHSRLLNSTVHTAPAIDAALFETVVDLPRIKLETKPAQVIAAKGETASLATATSESGVISSSDLTDNMRKLIDSLPSAALRQRTMTAAKLDAAVDLLLQRQNASGMWADTSLAWGAPYAADGSAAVTAEALAVLQAWRELNSDSNDRSAWRRQDECEYAIQRGTKALMGRQAEDNAWRDISCCGGESHGVATLVTTARTLHALSTLDAVQPTCDRATNYLLAQQRADGSWGGSCYATALATSALANQDSPAALAARKLAASYLVAQVELGRISLRSADPFCHDPVAVLVSVAEALGDFSPAERHSAGLRLVRA
jgi:squalene-hopene/tetraprenyl-beta-curcumene cyclase